MFTQSGLKAEADKQDSTKQVEQKQLKPVDHKDAFHRHFARSGYSADVIDDFSRMHDVLTSDVIDRNLKKLEVRLQAILESKNLLQPTGDKEDEGKLTVISKKDSTYTNHYHVLSEYIVEWSKENGFITTEYIDCIEVKQDKEARIKLKLPEKISVIFGGILSPDLFTAWIALGMIPKDISAGVSHAEFTHFLQIYVLVEENKANQFLGNDPVDLIKMTTNHTYKDRVGDFNNGEVFPWSLIFDLNPGTGSYSDPDYFHATLVNCRKTRDFINVDQPILSTNAYPILTQLLKGRADKRQVKYRQNPSTFFAPYLHPETKEKYLVKNGVVINDVIYLDTGDQTNRRVLFDDISQLLKLNRRIFNRVDKKVPLPKEDGTLYDKLLELFKFENHKNMIPDYFHSEMENKFMMITLRLFGLKSEVKKPNRLIRYRGIILVLNDYGKAYQLMNDHLKPYYQSILTVAFDLLEDAYKKDLAQLTDTPLNKENASSSDDIQLEVEMPPHQTKKIGF